MKSKYLPINLVIQACCGLIVVVCGLAVYFTMGYPQKWDAVTHGMTQEQVHQICGPPTNPGEWDVKGAFYNDDSLFGGWIFLASPRGGAVDHTRIYIDFGLNRELRLLIKIDNSYSTAIKQQFF